jgi:hypothetical protein
MVVLHCDYSAGSESFRMGSGWEPQIGDQLTRVASGDHLATQVRVLHRVRQVLNIVRSTVPTIKAGASAYVTKAETAGFRVRVRPGHPP